MTSPSEDRPAFGLHNVLDSQPYAPAVQQTLQLLLDGWQAGDGWGGVCLEHHDPGGREIVPPDLRQRAIARAQADGLPPAPIRVIIHHTQVCADQLPQTWGCQCEAPTVSVVRAPRDGPHGRR